MAVSRGGAIGRSLVRGARRRQKSRERCEVGWLRRVGSKPARGRTARRGREEEKSWPTGRRSTGSIGVRPFSAEIRHLGVPPAVRAQDLAQRIAQRIQLLATEQPAEVLAHPRPEKLPGPRDAVSPSGERPEVVRESGGHRRPGLHSHPEEPLSRLHDEVDPIRPPARYGTFTAGSSHGPAPPTSRDVYRQYESRAPSKTAPIDPSSGPEDVAMPRAIASIESGNIICTA